MSADFFEVGDKTALICTDSTIADSVRTTLRELGFKFHMGDTPELAIERTRYNPYDIIIVQDSFGGGTLKSNSVLNYLSSLAMAQRRTSMLVLTGSNFNTFDPMHAFSCSVQWPEL